MSPVRTRVVGVLVGLAAVVLAVLSLWRVPDTEPEPEAEPAVVVRPRPQPRRYPLRPPNPPQEPAPESDPVPPPSPEPAVDAPVTREASAAFSKATLGALQDIRDACVHPWLDEPDGPEEAEFVLNTLVVDGAVSDIELLTVQDLPPDVVDCIRDVAWEADWPTADLAGEVRFQKATTVRRRWDPEDDR